VRREAGKNALIEPVVSAVASSKSDMERVPSFQTRAGAVFVCAPARTAAGHAGGFLFLPRKFVALQLGEVARRVRPFCHGFQCTIEPCRIGS
jgi:hypothetical protein